MKATITITDTTCGRANVDLDFSEPTPSLPNQTAATKIAYELLEHIKRRTAKIGSTETHFAGGAKVVTNGNPKSN